MFNTTVKAVLTSEDGLETTHTCSLTTDTISDGLDALDSFARTIGLDSDSEDNIQQIHYTVVRV